MFGFWWRFIGLPQDETELWTHLIRDREDPFVVQLRIGGGFKPCAGGELIVLDQVPPVPAVPQ